MTTKKILIIIPISLIAIAIMGLGTKPISYITPKAFELSPDTSEIVWLQGNAFGISKDLTFAVPPIISSRLPLRKVAGYNLLNVRLQMQ